MTRCAEQIEFNLKKYEKLIDEQRTAKRFSHGQPLTPSTLVKEITDNIPNVTDAKIAVMFTVEWALYLERIGCCDITMITDKYDRVVHVWATQIIGCEYMTLDQVQEQNMKFDVVVGNPPFQNSGHKAKKNSLWKEFLSFAVSVSDSVMLVMPSSFSSPSGIFETYKSHTKIINFDVKKHFVGVGSSFCYIWWEKNFTGECQVITSSEKINIDLNHHDCLPETINTDLLVKMKSVFANNRGWARTCEYHTQNIDSFSEDGDITVIHGTAIKKTTVDHPNNSKVRVYCPTTTYPIFKVAHNVGLTQNQVWTECKSVEDAEKLVEYLNSDLVQDVLRNFKWSNMYYPQTISKL